jgi:hypothetical protein
MSTEGKTARALCRSCAIPIAVQYSPFIDNSREMDPVILAGRLAKAVQLRDNASMKAMITE